MPAWMITTLAAAAVVIVVLWMEAKANAIIAELKAIHENLDKLWAEQTADEDETRETHA